MKRSFYLTSALLLLFIVQSCSTVNIASNKQEGYNKQPKKIYIVISHDKASSGFCNGLVNGLKNKLTQKGIQTDTHSRDQLSLETEDELAKKVDAFDPEAVLMIQQTGTGESRNTFELTLIDKETKKRVWKGLFDISADSSYSSLEDGGSIDKSVKAIIDKLTQDKII